MILVLPCSVHPPSHDCADGRPRIGSTALWRHTLTPRMAVCSRCPASTLLAFTLARVLARGLDQKLSHFPTEMKF